MRRSHETPDARAPEALPDLRDWMATARPAGPLSWALRTAALAGLAAIFAAQYLAQLSGPGEVPATRVAQGGRVLPTDPETTGAIGRASNGAPRLSAPTSAARSTRIDPCTAPGPDRLRP